MTPNQSHIAGLELALQQWNNGGPAAHFAAQLRDLIDQAKVASCIDCKGSGFCLSIIGDEIRCPCKAPIQFSQPPSTDVVADHSAHHLNMVGSDHVPGATKMVTAYISGHLDEIDAPAWPFIKAEAVKVGAAKGHIDSYRYELANGGVVVLWNGYHLHALAVTIRDTMNRMRCIRMLANANAQGWISVDDRLPDEHKAEYLCLFEGGQQQVTEWLLDDTDGWVFWYGEPTHWMPLLAAPTEQVKP